MIINSKTIQKTFLITGVIAIVATTLPAEILAAEYYPKSIALRLFGTDQGNVGDCLSEAEIGAIEQAFSNHGLGVKLSLFHRHAFNWKTEPNEKIRDMKLELDASDRALVAQSAFIPNYMWPEDTEGYRPRDTGMRPSPSRSIVLDPAFPKVESFGYSRATSVFLPGYSNTASLASLKNAIATGNGVVLSVHGAMLMNLTQGLQFSKVTGLLETKYSRDALMEAVTAHKSTNNFYTGINHAVAVVGFDDQLYADQGYSTPGAILIRNSWNDESEIRSTQGVPSEADAIKLSLFRKKLAQVNLPGYYAIPYQYIIDLLQKTDPAKKQFSEFTVHKINYAGYGQKYLEIERNYQTILAPFICDYAAGFDDPIADARDQIHAFTRHTETASSATALDRDRSTASKQLWAMLLAETETRSRYGRYRYKFAKLSRNLNTGVDRVADFYAGQFNKYYCADQLVGGQESNPVWPSPSINSSPAFQEGLTSLSYNPYSPLAWYTFFVGLADGLTREQGVAP